MRDIEQYARDYQQGDFEETMVQYRRRKVLSILDEYKPKHILEIGCGLDSIANHYHEFESFTVVEPSNIFRDKACADASAGGWDIEVHAGYMENLVSVLAGKRHFDFVLCSGLLHEVEYPRKLLASIRAVCASDTVCHFNVPNSHSFHLVWARESGLIPPKPELTETALKLQQHTVFDKDSLKKMLVDAGFTVVSSGSYFIKPFNHAKMQELCKTGILSQALLDGLENMARHLPDMGAELYANAKLHQAECS